jgi:hypothetical protein
VHSTSPEPMTHIRAEIESKAMEREMWNLTDEYMSPRVRSNEKISKKKIGKEEISQISTNFIENRRS